MDYYGFVYLTENLVNAKKYIGQRSYAKPRWEDYLGSGKLLLRAIRKHGQANFRRTILFEARTKEELDAAEKRFIAEANAVEDKSYYNLVPGGHGCSMGFSGKKHSTETRRRMRQAALGHAVADHVRQAVSRARTGHVKSVEERAKISAAQTGAKHFRATPVVINGKAFETITDARRAGYSYAAVKRALAGKDHTVSQRCKVVKIHGVSFPSIQAAMTALGLTRRQVRALM